VWDPASLKEVRRITVKDGMLMVISPIEDTPAYRAGIKSGDHILKIDDKYTKDMTTMDAVNRMRGAKGTKVTLTIMREGFEKPKEFPLVRDVIQVKSVKYKTLDDGYGYIRIAQFQEKTDEDLVKALKSLRDANGGKLRGLVLDLRNDPGGLLDQAVRVSEHFVEEGKLIVYTEGREKDSKMRFTSRGAAKEPHYPIVVLINGGSASASEKRTTASPWPPEAWCTSARLCSDNAIDRRSPSARRRSRCSASTSTPRSDGSLDRS
jgi:carboxyl-terminal processing protease